MKIVQITDIHLGPDQNPVREIDVRSNFLKLLDLAETYNYDVLVLSGDLCYQDPDANTYDWVCKILSKKVTQPVYVIPGNHDDSTMISQFFSYDLTKDEVYYKAKLDHVDSIFLDSSKGYHSQNQKDWLRTSLLKFRSNPLLIFMHHPPVLGLVPYMDKHYSLKDGSEIMELLTSYPNPIHVFCGHYHVDKIITQQNVTVHITPSSFIQIDQRHEEFEVDHTRVGFRLIELNVNVVYSQVIWLN